MRSINIPIDVGIRAAWALQLTLKIDLQDLEELLKDDPEGSDEIRFAQTTLKENQKSYDLIRAALKEHGL
jgi:hypothetical protein